MEHPCLRTLLQAKLHRVRVTEADQHYEGSCGIDRALLDASIEAPRGSGTISLNGAAARKAMVGDLLIICAYSQYEDAEVARHQPVVVLVDENNQPQQG